jgi:hypothetical protein
LLACCVEKTRSTKNVVLLCGSKDLTLETGTAQFRLGVPGKKPTVRWPEVPVHPSKFVSVTRAHSSIMEELPTGGTLMQQITTVEVTITTPSAVAVVSTDETFSGGAESWFDSYGSLTISGMTRKFACFKSGVGFDVLEVVQVVEKKEPPAPEEKEAPPPMAP